MSDPRHVYFYSGPVYHYENMIADYWEAETTAPTLRKAKQNLAYRYKNEHGYAATFQISLPGQTIMTRE